MNALSFSRSLIAALADFYEMCDVHEVAHNSGKFIQNKTLSGSASELLMDTNGRLWERVGRELDKHGVEWLSDAYMTLMEIASNEVSAREHARVKLIAERKRARAELEAYHAELEEMGLAA